MDGSEISIVVKFDGASYVVKFSRYSEPSAVDRAISVACGVPWGSATQLVDDTGAVYATDPQSFPDGKELFLDVMAIPDPLVIGEKFAKDDSEASAEPEAETVGNLVIEPPPQPYKIIVVGESGVGKTAFVSRLKSSNPKRFKLPKEDPSPGIGVDVSLVELNTNHGSIALKLWDVAGSDEQSGMRDTYYTGADAAIVFFRFGVLSTYWKALKWQNEVTRCCGSDIPIIIVGLHSDHADAKEGGALADTPALKVSCKSGSNFFAPVTYLLRKISGVDELKCKQASSKTIIPDSFDVHTLVEHIASTWQ
jgi:small GTP-binding protein